MGTCMNIIANYPISALLSYSTPVGRGIDLTDRYIYQGHMAIHHIDPDSADGNLNRWLLTQH